MVLLLYIVRGVSGSGKSSLVNQIIDKEFDGKGHVFSTDEFFYDNGLYRFEPKKLGLAHDWNISRAYRAMHAQKSPIFIDNTNTQKWEAKLYVQFGLECGYEIKVIEPNTTWWKKRDVAEMAKRNRHSVTAPMIEQMLSRWETDYDVQSILEAQLPDFKKPFHQILYIIRGLPGSGKATLAKRLLKKHIGGYLLSPKDFIGYSVESRNEARQWNLNRVELLMDKNLSPLFVIDNFIERKDMDGLLDVARICNYQVKILEPQTEWWLKRDVATLSKNSSIAESEIADLLAKWQSI